MSDGDFSLSKSSIVVNKKQCMFFFLNSLLYVGYPYRACKNCSFYEGVEKKFNNR